MSLTNSFREMTPEEVANAKRSEQAMIVDGAEVDEEGRLEVTREQVQAAKSEMEKDMRMKRAP